MAKTQVREDEPQTEQEVALAQAQANVKALQAIADTLQAGPVKQVNRANRVPKTPWNPEGKKVRATLRCRMTQNDTRIGESRLSEEEINLFNQLKPGKYQGGNWVVTATNKDGVETLNLYIPNKTMSDRYKMKGIAGTRGLAGILDVIIAEAASAK